MQVRRQDGVPTSPPFIGVQEIVLDEATGLLYAKTVDGRVVPVNVAPSQFGANAGDARGADAVDLQYTRTLAQQVASGDRSFIGGGQNNEASGDDSFAQGVACAATGNRSHAEGSSTQATDQGAHSEGESTIASGRNSHAEGLETRSQGEGAHAEGSGSEAPGVGAHATGRHSQARISYSLAQAGGQFASVGDAQFVRIVVLETTTDATPKRLVIDPDESAEKITLEDDKLYAFRVMVAAKNTGADENAVYFLEGAIKRGTGAASTALLGAVTKTVHHEDVAGWDATAQADVANGALEIQVTGEAGKTIRWVAVVEWVEVGV